MTDHAPNTSPSPSATELASWEQAVLWLRAQPTMRGLVGDCYYDDPLIEVAQRYHHSDEWAAARAHFPGTLGRALDVGAGRGIASYALAKDGFSVVAVEPDSSAVVGAGAIRRMAADTALPIDVVESYSEQLPLPDREFDLVFVRAALHHTRDLRSACREFFRVLKPGGTLLAIREHVISRPTDLPIFLDRHPLHRYYGGENAFLLSQYRSAIESAGFTLTKIIHPLDSALNLAPESSRTFTAKIAAEVGRRLRSARLETALDEMLAMPAIWPVLRTVLRVVDHRPGRLYSFVATRR